MQRLETLSATSDHVADTSRSQPTRSERQQTLGGFLPRSLDGIVVIDARGRILEWNKGEEEITGIPRSEALGQPLWEVQYRLVPHEKKDPAFLEVAREKIVKGLNEGARLTRVIEDEIECRDGARRTVQVIIFNVQNGEEILACGISRDITEHKKMEQEQACQIERLALEIIRAEDEERKRVAEILHGDVQQQLAAAKLHLALLAERLKSDAALEATATRIGRMVTDALETARSLSHELSPPALSQCCLAEAFEWLADQMKERYGLTVRLGRCERMDLQSQPLRTFLFKAAQEMLFNVIKHSGSLEAELGVRRRRGCIRLFVSDRGLGFHPGALGNTKGYGLSSIRQRARFLGGRMRIRSAAGKGSFFLVTVPEYQPGLEHNVGPWPP